MNNNSKLQGLYHKSVAGATKEAKLAMLMMLLTEDEINLSGLIEKATTCLCEPNKFTYSWDEQCELSDGTIVTQDMNGAVYKAFDWADFNGKAKMLNTIRIFFAFSKTNEDAYLFQNMEEDSGLIAFYLPKYSNIDDGTDYYGSIFINAHYIIDLIKQHELKFSRIIAMLESTLYHEIQHYYDNIMGVYGHVKNMNEIVDLELWCDHCFDMNQSYTHYHTKDEVAGDYTYEVDHLNRFIYVIDNTEMNAYLNTFKIIIREYLIEHKDDFSEDELFKYIQDNRYEYYPFDIFLLYPHLKNLKAFMKYLNNIFDEDRLGCYFRLFIGMKNNLELSEKTLRKFNQIFVNKYLDTVNASLEEINAKLADAFIDFMDKEYIPYIFKIIHKKYMDTHNCMAYLLEIMINKYINK